MHALGEYVISVSAAALLWGILGSLMPRGPSKEILKLVAGLFLIFTVISPVARIDLSDLSELGKQLGEEGRSAAQHGEKLAEEAADAYIKQALEAYILDKAQALGLILKVQVTLQSGNLPEQVVLHGSAAPLLREKLTKDIQTAFGLPEEDIIWTGPD